MIKVTRLGTDQPFRFQVVVREGKGETRHEVTMSDSMFRDIANGAASPEPVIEAAFRFLLDREPKESILQHFDISVIARYFPEFPGALPRYLNATG